MVNTLYVLAQFNFTCIGLLLYLWTCLETLIPSLSLLSSNYEILDLPAKFQDKHYWSYFKLLPPCLSPKHFWTPTLPPVLSIWIPYLDVLFIFLMFKSGPKKCVFQCSNSCFEIPIWAKNFISS